MGKWRDELTSALERSGLARRDARASALLVQVRRGALSEGLARAYLFVLANSIQEQFECPNVLDAAPTATQLYGDAPPPICFATLTENGLRYGLELDPMRHTLIAGQTGSGKTTDIRRLILAICEFAEAHGRPICIVAIDSKKDLVDARERFGGRWKIVNCSGDLARITLAPPAGTLDLNAWINQIAEILNNRSRARGAH